MISNPYINATVKINYIVVDCKQNTLEEDNVVLRDRALAKLSKDRASEEVRHALNVWYYTEDTRYPHS